MSEKKVVTAVTRNLYQALDLSPNASHNEILHAYSRSKLTYTNGSLASYSLLEEEDRSSMLADIETAFETLGNPSKRREYDIKMGFESGKIYHEEGPVEATIRSRPSSEDTSAPAAPAPTPASRPTSAKTASITPLRARPEIVRTNYEPNPEFERKINETTSLDGAFLKAVRIYRGLSPEQVGTLCKLSASNVVGLEEENSSSFLQPVYLRGHLLLVCRVLELPEPEKLAKTYIEKMKSAGKLAKSPF